MQIWLTRCHLSVLARQQGLHRAWETPKGGSCVIYASSTATMYSYILFNACKIQIADTVAQITASLVEKSEVKQRFRFLSSLIVSYYWKARLPRGFPIKINDISISIRDCEWLFVQQNTFGCKERMWFTSREVWSEGDAGCVCGLQYPCCPLVEKQHHFLARAPCCWRVSGVLFSSRQHIVRHRDTSLCGGDNY